MVRCKGKINIPYLILFALLQFPLKLAGIKFMAYIYIYLIPFFYLLYHINWTIHFFCRIKNKYSKVSCAIFCYLIFISILWPLLTGTFDFTYITIYWRGVFFILLKYVFLLAVYEMHVNKEAPSAEEYCNYYIYSVILYIGFTILILVLPWLRESMMHVLYLEPSDIKNLEKASYKTRFGWGGWSGYGATMQCTLALAFACANSILSAGNVKKQTKYLILSGILMIGNSFYGRTGLAISVVCMLLTVLFAVSRKRIKYIVRIIFMAITMIIVLLLMRKYVSAIEAWFHWVFSILSNYKKLGHFYDSDGSVETILTRMYWMPDLETLLVGDGFYTDGIYYYMHTDSGIMRPILYYGAIHYIASLIAYFIIAYQLCKRLASERMLIFQQKYIRYIFFMFFIMSMLFEIKGESICTLIGMIFPITFITQKKIGIVGTENDKRDNEFVQ